jgi:hypothetical protein
MHVVGGRRSPWKLSREKASGDLTIAFPGGQLVGDHRGAKSSSADPVVDGSRVENPHQAWVQPPVGSRRVEDMARNSSSTPARPFEDPFS